MPSAFLTDKTVGQSMTNDHTENELLIPTSGREAVIL